MKCVRKQVNTALHIWLIKLASLDRENSNQYGEYNKDAFDKVNPDMALTKT